LFEASSIINERCFYALTAEGVAAKAPNFSKHLIEAQKEYGLMDQDIAVSRDRSPNLTDEPNLPYRTVMLKETFRWLSVQFSEDFRMQIHKR
jgi:hypothetical protein